VRLIGKAKRSNELTSNGNPSARRYATSLRRSKAILARLMPISDSVELLSGTERPVIKLFTVPKISVAPEAGGIKVSEWIGEDVVNPTKEVALGSETENVVPLSSVTVIVPATTLPGISVRKKFPPTAVTLLLVKSNTMLVEWSKVDNQTSPTVPALKNWLSVLGALAV
jgi:hypothetical protein